MNDAFWLAIMVAALFAVAVGLDRFSKRYAENHPLPTKCADEVPAFKDETSSLPIIQAQISDFSIETPTPLIRPRKNGAIKKCPVCKHRNRQYRCRAVIKTGNGKALKCNCANAFHKKATRKKAA